MDLSTLGNPEICCCFDLIFFQEENVHLGKHNKILVLFVHDVQEITIQT